MIADDVLANFTHHGHDAHHDGQADKLRAVLQRATVLRVQNVADYYWMGTPQDEFQLARDFPCLRPPWPVLWCEWRQPALVRAGTTTHSQAIAGEPMACLVETFPAGPGQLLVGLTCFMPRVRPHSVGAVAFGITEAGQYTHLPGYPPDKGILYATTYDSRGPKPVDIEPAVQAMLDAAFLFPVCLAVSLCHCKNVAPVATDLSPELVKKRAQRDRAPITRTYTLQIEAIRKTVLDRHAPGQPWPTALHLCRGHFKDYRAGPGLFGRTPGLFWWDLHARGQARRGQVVKDYAVTTPPPAPGAA